MDGRQTHSGGFTCRLGGVYGYVGGDGAQTDGIRDSDILLYQSLVVVRPVADGDMNRFLNLRCRKIREENMRKKILWICVLGSWIS